MSQEQIKSVTTAYNHLMESEKRGWDILDELITYLGYLDDNQLQIEARIVYEKYNGSPVKCSQDHPKDKCFIPVLIDAVGAILELYKETKNLHGKNKYILQYYLAIEQSGMIVVDKN